MQKNKRITDFIKESQKEKQDTPFQETKPVRESINKDMVQCNFNIHPDLKKRLKLRALEEGHGYKEIITEAIESYLK
jgi:hypothetical protein